MDYHDSKGMAWDLDQTNQGWATGPIYIPASAGIYTGLGPVKGMGQGANSQWSRTIEGDGPEAHACLWQSQPPTCLWQKRLDNRQYVA